MSRSALACPSCGAIRPASSADELGSEIATAKANHAQMVGAVLFFGGIILTLALGSDGTTWGLLSIGAGLIMIVAGSIDRNAARRRHAGGKSRPS